MTQNPYAGDFADEPGVYDEPPRTSVLAVISLILSLICCIPVLPLLGAGLGVGAMIGIGGSRGRVGGKGLAIAGIIIGVLVTFAQVGAYMAAKEGLGFFSQMVYGSTNSFMVEIEAGDYDAARAVIAGPATMATDEQFDAFRTVYQAEYGSFIEIPTDFFSEVIPAYMEIGQLIQPYQGRQDFIPIPASFDSGRVLMLGIVDPNGGGGSGGNQVIIPLDDVWIVLPDGTELRLMDTPSAPAIPPAPDAGEVVPEDDVVPEDEEP